MIATSEIPGWVERRVSSGLSALWSEYRLITIACVLLFFSAPIAYIMWRQYSEKKTAYFRWDFSSMKGHYGLVAVMLSGAILNLNVKTPFDLIATGFVLLLAIISIIFFFRRRAIAVVLMESVVFLLAVYQNYANVALVLRDDINDFTVPGKLGVFIVHDYALSMCMVYSIAAVILSAIVAIYYYKRRYLFRQVDGLKCEKCHGPVLKGDNFCIHCGNQATANPISSTITRLDEGEYCKICGSKLLHGSCVKHRDKTLLQEAKKEFIKKISIGLILAVLFILSLVPTRYDTNQFLSGNNAAATRYVERFNEFYNDQEVAKNKTWLNSFYADSDALYTIDSRWLYVSPGHVDSATIPYYAMYSEAAYEHMKVLEEISSMVDSGELNKELADRYNQVTAKKAQALKYYTSSWQGKNLLQKARFILVDSFRFYLGEHRALIGWIGVVAGVLLSLLVLNTFSTFKGWKVRIGAAPVLVAETKSSLIAAKDELIYGVKLGWYGLRVVLGIIVSLANAVIAIALLPLNIPALISWIKTGLRGKGDSSRQTIAISIVVAGLIALFIFILPKNTPEYKDVAQGVLTDNYQTIVSGIVDIQATRTLTDDEKEKLIQVIDDQISRDRIMMKLELNGEDEEFHNALQSFCNNEIQMLEDIKETIESGYIPTNQQLEPYVALRGADYLWLQEKLATDEVTDAISGFFED